MPKTYEIQGTGIVSRAIISDLGAAVVRLEVYDRERGLRDVVLGFEKAEDYINNPAFFGVAVGPIANRTANGQFCFNGCKYEMERNEGRNNLHFSLRKGLHMRTFEVESHTSDSIMLKLKLPDMEDGLPGNRQLTIKYTLTSNALNIDYCISSDKDTVFNITNHSYFNLNSHSSGPIFGHMLRLDCHSYTEIDDELIPTGKLIDIAKTDYDYSVFTNFSPTSKPIDHNFCRNTPESFGKAAELVCLKSGIYMTVSTDLPGIQVYTGGSIPEIDGKDGAQYHAFSGIALETQYYPNCLNEGIDNPDFEIPVIKAGEEYHSRTSYSFKIC